MATTYTYAKHLSGDTQSIDYTPDSALSGGDVVVISNNVWMATEPIAASELGALHIGGRWLFPKTAGTGESISNGVLIYWDDSGKVATTTASSNKKIGLVASAAGANDTTVEVLSIPQAV